MARNFEIIDRLQTHVEPELFARPGAYDGRKNFFMAFELPFGDAAAREVGIQVSGLILPRNLFHFFSLWSPWAPRRHRVKLHEVVAVLWSTGFV